MKYHTMCYGMIKFIGPIGDIGGPAIKNKLFLKYIDIEQISISNTVDKNIIELLIMIFKLIFSKDKELIVSVSKKGRYVLYPILYLKKKVITDFKYSLICIGGTIYQECERNLIMRYVLIHADIVTVETLTIKHLLESEFNMLNIHHMPNYKEMDDVINNEVKNFDDNLKFVFLSSVRNSKGIEVMIEAFKEVLSSFPQVTLDIYGPIRKDFDESIFDRINENHSIKYKGAVKNENVIKVLKEYDIFVFPSEYVREGFPAVLVEAFLAGLVVIASDVGYNCEIIEDQINGFIFKAGSKEELIRNYKKCFQDKNKLRIISLNNSEKARLYNVKHIVNEYKEILRKKGWDL